MATDPTSAKQTFVVKYEQFFTLPNDAAGVQQAVREALDSMREQAGARVTGAYVFDGDAFAPRNRKWRDQALDQIEMPSPGVITLVID